MRKSFVFLILVALVACSSGASSLPLALKGGASETEIAQTSSYSQLYSFKGSPDGAYPLKRLLNVDGVLYGTANWGGQPNRGSGGEQTGTIFEWSPSDGESTVHVFQDFPDGRNPVAGLISVKGELYGTTIYGGGPRQRGTVFKVSPSGLESILYRFAGPRDGYQPYSGLIYVHGLLYGTTYHGGLGGYGCADGCGTVYSLSLAGVHKVLYRFKGGTDGFAPLGNLLYRNGKFYGTTAGDYKNNGTVFEMSPSGVEHPLYNFRGQPDGATPVSGLIDVNGEFYGTTALGGSKLGGTLFKIDGSGHESVLHSFARGSSPEGGLIYVNGMLCGTTGAGGGGNPGSGTVYEVSLTGRETILYNFKGGSDGKDPTGGLINVDGTLYGTTSRGGTSDDGTLFSVTP